MAANSSPAPGTFRPPAGPPSPLAPLLFLLAAGGAALVFYAETRINRLVLGGLGESFSTKVYSAPFAIEPGTASPPPRLLERLRRLGYQELSPLEPGRFLWQPPLLRVALRGFKTPLRAQEAGEFALTWRGGLLGGSPAWELRDSSGTAVAALFLEPEVAAELSGEVKIRREPAKPEEIPEVLKKAVVAAEDKRFYSHHGFDWRATLRALWADVSGRGHLQGGSTITQQLSKNLFLSPRRTLRRKLAEAFLALYLELRFGKDKILTLYLNHIYLGQDGPYSVAGMRSAAELYFGKPLKDLTLSECATLAGLVRSPHRYNPTRDPKASKERRDQVLRRMTEDGAITPTEMGKAMSEPLSARRPAKAEKSRDSDYFVAEVVRELSPRFGEEALFRHGLAIYTTMDPLLQRGAQRAVRMARTQAALVALDPRDGRVLALVGGKLFGESQFNRATQASRQPGSAFKPFVYGAALEKGFTPATLLQDNPTTYLKADGEEWRPENYEGLYFGTTTVREALTRSLNAATLDLAGKVGLDAVLDFARRVGIKSPLERSLAMAMGASEVNLLELSAAYAPFANGGFRVSPRLVPAVLDSEGNSLESAGFEREAVLPPALAYLLTSLLQGVVAEGTARSLAELGWKAPSAGKTGTTNDGRDAWFIGFTPRLLAGVWVGDDQHKSLGLTGARDAVPAWAAFMKDASADFPPEDFGKPEGLVSASIDPLSGLKARSGCPQKRSELFLAGTEPTLDCPLHSGGIAGWFKRLFSRP